ncbi:clathrin heavy chain [Anopheles sinensis]|uniref:Clathrin heavy chain n=1 Tax=Anopheles sinensis TaxID=74873 RepID=A0A084VFY4_ANOSI|nr:clathrin heavy chain [Anopheles sinensis]
MLREERFSCSLLLLSHSDPADGRLKKDGREKPSREDEHLHTRFKDSLPTGSRSMLQRQPASQPAIGPTDGGKFANLTSSVTTVD